MQHSLLQDIVLLLIVSVPLVILTIKTKMAPLIGFMVTGILLGPNGLGFIKDHKSIEQIAEIGVVLLLFSVGLQFSLKEIFNLKKTMLVGGSLQVFLTLFFATSIGILLNWSNHQSLYFGAAVSLSSTAVVLASLAHHQSLHTTVGRAATGILIFQDFMVIPFLAFLPLFVIPSSDSTVNGLMTLALALGKIGVVFVVSYTLHKWLLHSLFHLIIRLKSDELLIVTILALAIGMSWLTHILGLSYALGAFIGGLLLSTTKHRDHALGKILPFSHGFSALFFASIGMLFSTTFFIQYFWTVLALVTGIPLIKVLVTFISVRLIKHVSKTALSVALLLGQIGEFSFLLGFQGYKLGVFSDFFYQLIISFTVVTLLMTPLVTSIIFKKEFKWKPVIHA
jgi:monovalent cation:H+ antiporter-2, CPA2 family